MHQDQTRSFIAKIRCNKERLLFLDAVLPPSSFEPGALRAGGFAGNENVLSSPSLSLKSHSIRALPEMAVYFECFDDYYNIRIVSAAYFGKYLSKNEDGKLAALPGAGANTTS